MYSLLEKLTNKLYEWRLDLEYGIFRSVTDTWWNIKTFIKNIWRYREWLSHDSDWDYEYLLEIMELKLRYTADCLRRDLWHENSSEYADQALRAAEIVRQLRCDEVPGTMDFEESWKTITDAKSRKAAIKADKKAYDVAFKAFMKEFRLVKHWWC